MGFLFDDPYLDAFNKFMIKNNLPTRAMPSADGRGYTTTTDNGQFGQAINQFFNRGNQPGGGGNSAGNQDTSSTDPSSGTAQAASPSLGAFGQSVGMAAKGAAAMGIGPVAGVLGALSLGARAAGALFDTQDPAQGPTDLGSAAALGNQAQSQEAASDYGDAVGSSMSSMDPGDAATSAGNQAAEGSMGGGMAASEAGPSDAASGSASDATGGGSDNDGGGEGGGDGGYAQGGFVKRMKSCPKCGYADGGTVDPVPQNVKQEMPASATADDVPAKLSQGEFVMDAATTAYFGVDKLVKMQQKAHAFLQRHPDKVQQMMNKEGGSAPPQETPEAPAQGNKPAQAGSQPSAPMPTQAPLNPTVSPFLNPANPRPTPGLSTTGPLMSH
jgi:hypothetical protein